MPLNVHTSVCSGQAGVSALKSQLSTREVPPA